MTFIQARYPVKVWRVESTEWAENGLSFYEKIGFTRIKTRAYRDTVLVLFEKYRSSEVE